MGDAYETETVRRPTTRGRKRVEADVCVVGAGISGLSAALEAAKAGADVVLVDAASSIGGQAVGSIVGTIIGLYTHGDDPSQLTYGVAEDLISDLEPTGALRRRRSSEQVFGREKSTILFQYDQIELGRWFERRVDDAGITTLVDALVTDVRFDDGRVRHVDVEHRFGGVRIHAEGYVDATGDASLTWQAGLPCREPTTGVYGTMHFLVEDYDADAVEDLDMGDVNRRLEAVGSEYGLDRESGHLKRFPEREFVHANVTHVATPLDPLASGQIVFDGRRKADGALEFLRNEYPDAFAGTRIRTYADPGIRMTRWIVGHRQLTIDDLAAGERRADAVGRAAWWVELHDSIEGTHWEEFPSDHVYYIPLSCMVPEGADNVVAAGRCVDADTRALSAIRVMGPCIAMGAAAAHALDLAGTDPVHEVDMDALQARLHDNLERTD